MDISKMLSRATTVAEMKKRIESEILLTNRTLEMLEQIHVLHAMGRENTSSRARNGRGLLIQGASGAGKSNLIDIFKSGFDLARQQKFLTVVPGQPAKSPHIIINMLSDLGDDCPSAGNSQEREKRCIDLLYEHETEIIFFDELHQFTSSGATKDVNTRGGHWLKYFMDKCGIPVVGFATEEVKKLFSTHEELSGRFDKPTLYDPLDWNDKFGKRDFLAFLFALEELLDPLDAEGVLTDHQTAAQIRHHSGGRFRLIKKIVSNAAATAIRLGLPRLSHEHVVNAARLTGIHAMKNGRAEDPHENRLATMRAA